VIITRTPLRISLGGGGTDVPNYYRTAGGFLVAAAISKYVYIAVNHNFDGDILLKYSTVERVAHPKEAVHPLLRESLLQVGIESAIEVSSMADIPAGTGLGSSGSFAVGLLRALHAHHLEVLANDDLAEEACHIEIERLQEPIGKQDQYIAAVGGITAFEFHPDGTVSIIPVRVPTYARHLIEDNLLLFYTGVRRSASDVLAVEQQPHAAVELSENLDAVKELGRASFAALEDGDLATFARLLTEQWNRKLERSPSAIHDRVDSWIRDGIGAGALGGKLVGAGGGGFLLFYAEEKTALRDVMADHGLEEVRFRIDYEGSTTIVSA
jgi:D-glycero-alpha-D-manno-heptose-7-phosphate kinase